MAGPLGHDLGHNYPKVPAPEHHPADRDGIHYSPEVGWFQQDPHHPMMWRKPNRAKFRPKHYWVRPTDGKRKGTMGRLKDGLSGEGPDVFVASVGDDRYFWDSMPSRADWSGWNGPWYDPDWALKYRERLMQEDGAVWDMKRTRGARKGKRYDWCSRRFAPVEETMISDVMYRGDNPRRSAPPIALRDFLGGGMGPMFSGGCVSMRKKRESFPWMWTRVILGRSALSIPYLQNTIP
ncbi:hypothetical protein H2203_007249 [Taxawa tesnikishii (nom. ined.)]|nr:hypothetical protein H2203_007249 [Dothideales sp. JES 119]